MTHTPQAAFTITTAPCCLGVDDVRNPDLPPWQRALEEAAQAGYGGIELGPNGYMPYHGVEVAEALAARGLFIVTGTIFDDLVSPAEQERDARSAGGSLADARASQEYPKSVGF